MDALEYLENILLIIRKTTDFSGARLAKAAIDLVAFPWLNVPGNGRN